MRVVAYFILIILTGLLLGGSYYYLVYSVKQQLATEIKHINSEVYEINKLQAAYPRSISMANIMDYDRQHSTSFSIAIMSVAPVKEYAAQSSVSSVGEGKLQNQINEKLEAMKAGNLVQRFKIEDVLDWWAWWLSYFPPFPVIILAGISIFFTSLINNLGAYCFKRAFKQTDA